MAVCPSNKAWRTSKKACAAKSLRRQLGGPRKKLKCSSKSEGDYAWEDRGEKGPGNAGLARESR
jgi:hypothetical protein